MRKDPAFQHASENWGAFRDELDERMRRFEARNGTLAYLDALFQKQMLQARTCPECSFVCKTQHHMEYRHKNSTVCLRRIAEQLGKEYIAPARQRITCECGITVFKCNMEKHLRQSFHKNEMAKKNGYYCEFCQKAFKGKRPRRDFNAHCKGKKHLKRVAAAAT